MRILLVTDSYPPFIGGVHRQIQLLSRQLRARGHEVRVITVWSPGTHRREPDDGIVVHRVHQLRSLMTRNRGLRQHYAPPFPDPLLIRGIRRVVREFEPSLVHAYGWLSYSAAIALRGSEIPLVLSVRDYAYSCPTRTLLHNDRTCGGPRVARCLGCASRYYGPPRGWAAVAGVAACRKLIRSRAAGYHFISRYVESVVRRDIHGGRMIPVPSVIIPSFGEDGMECVQQDRPDIRSYCAQLPSTPYILFVGAFRHEKGVKVLFEAYGRLTAPPPLVMIGTHERDTPATVPPGVVTLHDFPHPAVMAAWQRALFGVVPSLWPEPLGSVVYEGMRVGRPVIGTRPGGHEDMITDGESGLLVPSGDVGALVKAMELLLGDAALRERMGEAARTASTRYTASRIVPEFERYYRELIA